MIKEFLLLLGTCIFSTLLNTVNISIYMKDPSTIGLGFVIFVGLFSIGIISKITR